MTAPTETVNETVETEATDTENADVTEVPAFDVSTLDEFGQEFVKRTVAEINRYNGVVANRKAMSTDANEVTIALYDALKEGNVPEGLTIDPKVIDQYNKAREIVEKALSYFMTTAETTAKERVAASVNAEEVAALDTEIDTLSKKIKRARDMLALEYPGAETALPDVARLRGSSTGGSGKGSGGRKLRGFTVTVDGTVALLSNNDGKKVSSFSAGAKQLGIPTADLQRAYMTAAGTEDAEKFPESQELTVTGADGKEHAVKIDRNKE